MIAGELDISIGSMIPAGSMVFAIISGYFGLPVWAGMGAALLLGVVIGLINGFMVLKTSVPSLIVTLGTLFAVAGTDAQPVRSRNRHNQRCRRTATVREIHSR